LKVKLKNKIVKNSVEILFLNKKLLESSEYQALLNQANFEAKDEQVCMLHEAKKLCIGLENFEKENLRVAATKAVQTIKNYNYESAYVLHSDIGNVQALVEGFILGGYEFNTYKSKTEKLALQNIYVVNENSSKKYEKNFNDALIIANATNFTRSLVNTAPQELNPSDLAHEALKLVTPSNSVEAYVVDYEELEKMDMNAICAVGRASIHKPKLIHVSYKPKKAKHTISLVGKGLTYDSGGLSLKPATSMLTMKMDKAGACAVLGIVKAVSELELPIEINAFIGAAENMVDANSYKPDDILVAKNGKTIEVKNTDAEGRLVLADVLCYAQENVTSEYIFDYATLTGACMVALGNYTTGVMGHSSRLKHQFFNAAQESGELVGALPFNKHLKKLLKSNIADISNIGSKPYGGAITAALFLDEFIQDDMKEKWLHFDIAGTAYTDSPWDCNVVGATGAGVRISVEFMKQLLKK